MAARSDDDDDAQTPNILRRKKQSDDEESEDEKAPLRETSIQILPYLFIGDKNVAAQEKDFKAKGITDILNLASGSVPCFFEDNEAYSYKNYSIEDPEDEDLDEEVSQELINKTFEEIYELIKEVKESNTPAAAGDAAAVAVKPRKILVHCVDGGSVTGMVVVAYMLLASKRQNKNLTLEKAYDFIRGKDPLAEICEPFIEVLIELEVELYGQASIAKKAKGRGGKKASANFGSSGGGKDNRNGRGGRGGKYKSGKGRRGH